MSSKKREEETLDQEMQRKLKSYAKTDLPKIRKLLMGVIEGTKKEKVWDGKKQKFVEREAPIAVKIQAARAYKESVQDKVVADRKMNPKEKGESFSPTAAIREIHESKKKLAAGGGGKVVKGDFAAKVSGDE